MKKKLLLLLLVCTCDSIYSQNTKTDSSSYCSKVIKQISYFWKLDSLANNGFRLYSYEKLINCKIDEVDRELLLAKLGKPSKIWKTNKGTEYLYYCYDSKAMPKEIDSPFECIYVSFKFGEYDKYLSSIEEGVLDY